MQVLQTLLENEGIQTLLSNNEDMVYEATGIFNEFPQVVKDHITANLDSFIVPGNIQETYNNMVEFTRSSVTCLLDELTEAMG
jgi:hypothetical protein